MRELQRLLRWRHPRFARFRGRHWYLTLRAPFRNAWYLVTHPDVAVFSLRIRAAFRRAVAQGETVICA